MIRTHSISRFLRGAVAALALAACDDGLTVPRIEETVFAPSLNVDLDASVHTASGMYYRDLSVGGGATIADGHVIAIHYTGYLADGTIFDINVPPKAAFQFSFPDGDVIAGVLEGVAGMKIGGIRQLIIPPSLGYGGQARGPIPANSILVFTIEVVGST